MQLLHVAATTLLKLRSVVVSMIENRSVAGPFKVTLRLDWVAEESTTETDL